MRLVLFDLIVKWMVKRCWKKKHFFPQWTDNSPLRGSHKGCAECGILCWQPSDCERLPWQNYQAVEHTGCVANTQSRSVQILNLGTGLVWPCVDCLTLCGLFDPVWTSCMTVTTNQQDRKCLYEVNCWSKSVGSHTHKMSVLKVYLTLSSCHAGHHGIAWEQGVLHLLGCC